MPSRDLPPHLRVIPGERIRAARVDEAVVTRTAMRGERNEPWTLCVDDGLRALAAHAAELGLDLELALRLALETALATAELTALRVDLDALDRIAGGAAVDRTVDACHAAYLRRLTTAAPCDPVELDALFLAGLPVRLSTRLLSADLAELLAAADLERARAWEIAAVLDGRTISEWAPLTALAL
jgi:hypothetical protein